MNTQNKLNIGLFGFGCVGQGLYDILHNNENFSANIAKICVKHPDKPRSIAKENFTYQADEILNDEGINLVVELIDNAQEAFLIVSEALRKGKSVVTANKKMLAEHLPELVALQQTYKASLLYEASACGSIPIIRTLEEYYNNEQLSSVSGIFNGSTNYILTKIIEDNLSYEQALQKAQELGFAETDPSLDVGGYDPKYKLCILALHAFGIVVAPEKVLNYGIQQLSIKDLQYAKEKGWKIKLIAQAYKTQTGEIALWLMPAFIAADHPLYHVENETNGVIVEALFSQKQVFIGKGAGGHPTGSAVLSDISACLYDYHYEYKKHFYQKKAHYTENVFLEIYLRYQHPDNMHLEWEYIEQQFSSAHHKYIVGVISLENLRKQKENLQAKGVFVAHTGRVIEETEIRTKKAML